MTIGKRLREERERIGYSQLDFAALGGKTKKTQIEWEADKATPNAAFLAEVERVGVDVLYVLTGRREAPLADGYHAESSDGIEAVLDRMFDAVGKPLGFGYAQAFDVSERTLAAWRTHGQVARRYLEGFAKAYNKPLEWLLHGEAVTYPANQNVETYGLSDDETLLLKGYRSSSPDVRAAALRMLSSQGEPPPERELPRRIADRPSDLPEKRFKKPTTRGGS